jgi:energy-coupling factor transport system substrate-specific component
MRRGSLYSRLVLLLASLIGVAAFLYPFLLMSGEQGISLEQAMQVQEAPLLTIVVVVLCLGAILATLGSGIMNAKMVAILGMLTAANAVLRALPGPAGFSAVFVLPILCGYAYGASFGFLLGSLSLLTSALIGGGVGPWLPYQMLAVGWVGLTAAWIPRLERWPRMEVAVLGVCGLVWGFVFGAIMNIWFWPYLVQPQALEMYWAPGMGLGEVLERYAVFYLVTSLWWDIGRAVGNALLIGLLARPLLALLRRFERRFQFAWTPTPTLLTQEGAPPADHAPPS